MTSAALPFEIDSPLPKGGELPLGYGSGAVRPLGFGITTRGRDFETGHLKIFNSSKAIDLSNIPQPLFSTRAGSVWKTPDQRKAANPAANFWGTIQIPVFMTRRCNCSIED